MASVDDTEEWETWTSEELERQMSSSRWNPKKSPEDVISDYIAICAKETENAKRTLQYEANIAYGTEPRQKYDVYGTDLPDKAPIFFWIHGGFWQEGSKDMSAMMARNLHEIGVKTLVLGYTLAPEAKITQIKSEFHSALAHAMKKYLKANFFIGGHSAGGHLAATLLHENELIDFANVDVKRRVLGLTLFSGVFDLRLVVPTYVNQPLNLTKEEAKDQSPLHLPFAAKLSKDINILVLVGGFDSPEFQRQSRVYSIKLRMVYQNVRLCVSSLDDHFTLVEKLMDLTLGSSGNILRDFIQTTLKTLK